MNWIDAIPISVLLPIALLSGLAPSFPEPHLWEKLKLLAAGQLHKPIDIFDLFWHAAPIALLALKLIRMWQRGELSS